MFLLLALRKNTITTIIHSKKHCSLKAPRTQPKISANRNTRGIHLSHDSWVARQQHFICIRVGRRFNSYTQANRNCLLHFRKVTSARAQHHAKLLFVIAFFQNAMHSGCEPHVQSRVSASFVAHALHTRMLNQPHCEQTVSI